MSTHPEITPILETLRRPEALTVLDPQRGALLEELDHFTASLPSPQAREPYFELRRALDAGAIPSELQEPLGRFLEIALSSGAIRHGYGPGIERSVLELFRQTPGGSETTESVRQVNRALAALAGQRIEKVSFRAGMPGSHGLVLETEQCRIRLEIDRHGTRVRDVALAV